MTDILEGLLLDESGVVTHAELCGSARVTPAELDALIALGVVPAHADRYPAVCVGLVRRAARLKRGLDTDWELVAVIMDLLHEIDDLHREVRGLKARLR
ncbi:chaperone modulator CbpM [Acidiferrobacter sp.]|uniref:chaperone modulator CbpM n=1 Tax=Acidiferrobacter sp. TaxID=1872107 RepID=UPI002634D286|nr:chaperone modulator CbpM [Acidiferrobacter sp.]